MRLKTVSRLARNLGQVLLENTNNPSNTSATGTTLFAAGILVAASTTSWAAAADPNTPIPGPPSQLEASTTPSNDGTAQWRVFTDIARDLVRQGRKDEAERYLKRALEAAKKGFGEKDPHVASACQNLAEIYRLQKKYDLAGPLYDQSLAILGETYGPRDIRVAFALHNVAGYYFAQRDWEKAGQYYGQALQVKLASVGPGHMETSNTMFHLAEVRWAQKRTTEAIQLAEKSLDAMEQQGASDAACSRRRMRLAEMLMEEKRFKDAEPLLRKVLAEAAVEGVGRAPAAESLARALKELGNYKEAEYLLKDSINRRKEHGGGEHPATAAALRRLAEVHIAALKAKLGTYRPAEVVEEQINALNAAKEAVEIAEKALAASEETTQARESLKNETSNEEDKGWFGKIMSLLGVNTTPDQSTIQRALRAVKPEIASIELASDLSTLAQVQMELGGSEEEIQGYLQRSLDLVTASWPGRESAATRVEELRHQTLCSTLAEMLGYSLEKQGKASEKVKGIELMMKEHGCDAVVDLKGKKKRWWGK